MDIYNHIQLEFTRENARKILGWGSCPDDSPYSHLAIAAWCERFWNAYCEIDAPPEIEEILPLLSEIETEWDVFVAEFESKSRRGATSALRLPSEYFSEWLERIDE